MSDSEGTDLGGGPRSLNRYLNHPGSIWQRKKWRKGGSREALGFR